jgi:hypothetical protein
MLSAIACIARRAVKEINHDEIPDLLLISAALLACMVPSEAFGSTWTRLKIYILYGNLPSLDC